MMREELIKRNLQLYEINEIVKIVRTSFNPNYLIPSIYRTDGIQTFLTDEINNAFSPFEYSVLSNKNDELLAFAEFKIFYNKAFLNIIATSTNQKNKGVSTILFKSCYQELSYRGFKTIELDVFKSNNIALHWYQNLGFKEIERFNIYKGNFSNTKYELNFVQIMNYPQFCTLFYKLGFAYLEFYLESEYYKIGIIKDSFIVRNIYSEALMSFITLISTKLGIKSTYFILKENDYKNLEVLDTIIRMRI